MSVGGCVCVCGGGGGYVRCVCVCDVYVSVCTSCCLCVHHVVCVYMQGASVVSGVSSSVEDTCFWRTQPLSVYS